MKSKIKIKMGIINTKTDKYYCTCGNSGDFVRHSARNKAICSNCGSVITYAIGVSKSTAFTDYMKRIVSADCIDVLNSFLDSKVTETDTYYIVDFYDARLLFEDDGTLSVNYTGNAYYIEKGTFVIRNKSLKELLKIPYEAKHTIVTLLYDFLGRKLKYSRDDINLYLTRHSYISRTDISSDFSLLNKLKALESGAIYCLIQNKLECILDCNSEIGDFSKTNLLKILDLPSSLVKCLVRIADSVSTDELNVDMSGLVSEIRFALFASERSANGNAKKSVNGVVNILESAEVLFYSDIKKYAMLGNAPYMSKASLLQIFSSLVNLAIDLNYDIKTLEKYVTRGFDEQGIDSAELLSHINDYANMCKGLGIKYKKYPYSVKLSHDVIMRKYTLANDASKDNILKGIVDKSRYLEYSDNTFSVRLLESGADFVKEGSMMHHCVASYVDRVLNNSCVILSVRGNTNMDKPLTTIEVKGTNVLQVKGFSNQKPDKDILAFVRVWIREKKLGTWVSL